MFSQNVQNHLKNLKYDDNFYEDIYTLDPSRVDEVWDRLTADQALINLGFLPEAMARAVYETLKERGHLKEVA